MRNQLFPFLIVLVVFATLPLSLFSQYQVSERHQEEAARIIDAATRDHGPYERLAYFGDRFGHRFSGSESLERSLDWILEKMREQGFDKVWGQPVKVPHWVRGEESATLISPRKVDLPMLGLGGSIGTPPDGITADVIVVKSFDELIEKQDEVKGKIVLYNVAFTGYGQTVRYRSTGAVTAAKYGAVASLVRSVGPFSMKTPHTGNSRYEPGITKIPHAAITVEDAMMLQRMYDNGEKITIHLKMGAQTLPDADSRNVIAEIRGSEYPDEVVVFGGHIDSWDVGNGMMDDGGGCFAAWEALRIIKDLGLKPKRTIRLVLWTNEENGLRGATEYHRWVKEEEQSIDKHVLAIESDAGVFDPLGFGFTGTDEAYDILTEIGKLLEPIESGEVFERGGGADIGPLMQDGVPGMGLVVDGTKYFWYHHTEADTIDKLDPDDFNECIATMAVFAYIVADMDQTLPR